MEKTTVKYNTKKWHYKFMKFMLGSIAPTPKTIHNLCPYFYLLIFTILTCVFILPIKGIIFLFKMLDNFVLINLSTPTAVKWETELTDLDVYQIWIWEKVINKTYKNVFGNAGSDDFVTKWWSKKYDLPAFKYVKGCTHALYTHEFEEWIVNQRTLYNKMTFGKYKEKTTDLSDKISDKITDFVEILHDYISSWKNIIKWTKRIVGLIITSMLLFATYFLVNFLGRGILWLVVHWSWPVFFSIVMFSIIGTIAAFLSILMGKWVIYIKQNGITLWYIKPAYYFTYWVLWIPIKYVFYIFLWKIILVNLFYFISSAAKLIYKSILGFLGIFGEYFGASYTDYCPGIEWEEEND